MCFFAAVLGVWGSDIAIFWLFLHSVWNGFDRRYIMLLKCLALMAYSSVLGGGGVGGCSW